MNYYDTWGNRCFVFSSELGRNYQCSKEQGFSINTQAAYAMGARYLFSAVEIKHPPQGMALREIFEDDISAWRIYLYEIMKS